MTVIYNSPTDLEPGFAVRRWSVARGIVMPGKLIGSGLPSLESARSLVPHGRVNIGRCPDDDPKIVEVWLASWRRSGATTASTGRLSPSTTSSTFTVCATALGTFSSFAVPRCPTHAEKARTRANRWWKRQRVA